MVQAEANRFDKLEIQQYRQEIKERIRGMLAKTKGRFVEKEENTITDTKTGLTWSMMDSQLELNECMDYKSAQKYVNNLSIGKYQDWRLPSVKELTGIYKTEPFFPSWVTKWFWTSSSYKQYSGGWIISVDIVTSKKETSWSKERANSLDCGAVHAVRP
jgi:hypothetical protein